MKIDFNEIELQHLANFKGGEKHFDAKMYFDGSNRIMQGCLVPGASIGEHTHADSSEIIFVTSGEGTMIIDGKVEMLRAGDCHYCPKGSTHSFVNKGVDDLRFVAVVPMQ